MQYAQYGALRTLVSSTEGMTEHSYTTTHDPLDTMKNNYFSAYAATLQAGDIIKVCSKRDEGIKYATLAVAYSTRDHVRVVDYHKLKYTRTADLRVTTLPAEVMISPDELIKQVEEKADGVAGGAM